MDAPSENYESFVDPVDGTRWRIDLGFIGSNWTCQWGDGCPGILDRPAAELEQGCCSVGAGMLDDDEARRIQAIGLTLDPNRFQYADVAAEHGIFVDDSRRATRVVDDACIFLNRPGFEGGTGCALHLAAVDEGDAPIEWKPAVCWQLPLKVEEQPDGVRVLHRWGRADWGDDAVDLAWCCTEDRDEADAYRGETPVIESLADELRALLGQEVVADVALALKPSPNHEA